MQNRKDIVPARIKQARESRGYSMGELAELLDISRAVISQYEMGTTSPSWYIIGQMSNILHYDISFFKKEMPVNDTANSAVFFRSQKTSTQKMKKAMRQKISIFREINDYLNEFVEFPETKLPEIQYNSLMEYDEIPFEDIERYAMEVRRFWKLGDGPIENLMLILQKSGVCVSSMNLKNKKIDAFSVWYNSIPFIFLSNEKYSNARLRFDMAHELGHLLMHASIFTEDKISKKVIDRKLEAEANAFAGALLMPEKSFSKDIYSTSINHFIQLKKKWKVSIASMIYRCQDLNLLTENQLKYLKNQMAYNQYWRKEPLDNEIPLEQPFAHRQAFELLLDNNIVTPSEVVEAIGCESDEIEEYSFLPKGMLTVEIPSNVIRLRDRA